MDVDDAILEYFEEHDWEMNSDAVDLCAQTLLKEFDSEDDAVEYVQNYLHSIFNN